MKRKIIFAILVIISLLSIITIAGITLAEDLGDIQERKNKLQEQISKSNDKIEDIKIELTENLKQLSVLNEKIKTYEDEVKSLDKELNTLNEQVESVSSRLNTVEENYNNQRNALQSRIVAMYEAGDIYYLDVLLKSNSFSEFISNYYLIGEIARQDNELLESIQEQKDQIEEIKNTLTNKQEELKKTKDDKEKIAISLENSKTIKNSYIAKLTDDEKAMQDKVDKYTAELNSLDTQITALTTILVGEDYVGGEFMWPAPGYSTITSYFGMRYHPVLQVYSTHKGTDIAVPMGSYVVASNDGVVISSSYVTGYGNMIMIDHGGGISTLYAHGSELIAKLGDKVKKGDLIMKSGSTGWSTGPHLHFEVRLNGTPVDSLDFLNNQSKYLKTEKEENQNIENTDNSNEVNNIM